MSTNSMPVVLLPIKGEVTKAEIIISLCFFLSFMFSLFVLPRIILISKRKSLYDDPDARKSHSEAIPRLGGLVFIPSVLIALSFSTAFRFLIDFPFNSSLMGNTLLELLFLIAGSLFLFFIGVKDDLVGVPYRKKFVGQFLVAFLFPMSGLYINNMYGIFGVYEVPALIGCFAMGPAAGMAQIAIMIPTTSVTIKVAENSFDAPSLSRLPSMFPTAMEPPIPRQ